jgi:hypothetical protein
MTNQTQADLVIERFGGIQRMSELTDNPVERIRNWRRAGRIPQLQHLPILLVAQHNRIQLLPHDLIAYLTTQLLAAAQASDSTMPGGQPDIAA